MDKKAGEKSVIIGEGKLTHEFYDGWVIRDMPRLLQTISGMLNSTDPPIKGRRVRLLAQLLD